MEAKAENEQSLDEEDFKDLDLQGNLNESERRNANQP